MLYLKSVLFYVVILLATEFICKTNIVKNGWVTKEEQQTASRARGWMAIISVAAIPVFRFIMVLVMFMMAGMTKEDYQEKMRVIKEFEDDDND